MNFYKRFIGDYQRDTGHLSMAEHGAYTLMLDVHYATEKPLPRDRKALYRLLRAIEEGEETAIDRILDQFWMETDDGWVNPKALRLMADKRKRSKEAKRSATKRWSGDANATPDAPDSDANALQNLCDSDANAMQNLCESDANAMQNLCDSDASHSHSQIPKPESHSQIPEPEPEREPPLGEQVQVLVGSWNDWAVANNRPRAKLTQKRRSKVQARIREGLKWEAIVPELDQLSDFALGKSGGWNGITFQWLTDNEENWTKLQAGNYRRIARSPPSPEDSDLTPTDYSYLDT